MVRRSKILHFPGARQFAPRAQNWLESLVAIFAIIFCSLVLLHGPLLRLPYFWDEAGYYVPAARDLLLHRTLIPQSTLTNAHPPLVMAWLALGWKIFGFRPLITRLAMLAVSSFALVGVFRLSRQIANVEVAFAATLCTALYPVFFAQSSLAHLDMTAAAFTLWGLCAYICDRRWQSALWFSLAALSKETALLAPLALIAFELIAAAFARRTQSRLVPNPISLHRIAWLAVPVAPLAIWFAWHFHRTGFVFGNPEFVRYNVAGTLHPLRIVAALAQRLWQLLGYLNMFVLTVAAVLAMRRAPSAVDSAATNGGGHALRPRIAIPTQLALYAVVFAYIAALSVIGGAVLARYLLPVYPLIIIVCVSTIWRRVPWWKAFVGVVCIGFVIGLVTDPPYRAAPEDNLSYTDFITLHQRAAINISAFHPGQTVLTAWPATDELTRPFLGYTWRPISVCSVENFSQDELDRARTAAFGCHYDLVLLFSTKYEPASAIRSAAWDRLQSRYFGYHRDLSPDQAARLLDAQVLWQQRHRSQWIALLEMHRVVNAGNSLPLPLFHLTK